MMFRVKLTRRTALGKTAAFAASAGVQALVAQETGGIDEGERTFLRLLKSSDETVLSPPSGRGIGRGAHVASLVAAYCSKESVHYREQRLIPLMEGATRVFVDAQNPDGTLDAGNLASPPDTGFVVEGLAASLGVLRRTDEPGLRQTKDTLTRFLLAAGEALVTGGVHTPNHRWVVCCALARINALFPSARYVNRIDDWLGEGIYQDADGQFEERSTGIYSRVTDNAFLTISRLLNRPALLEPVRKNLEMNLYYLHPDGELETVASRRQDQNMAVSVANYYLQYRYLAIHDNNPRFAAVTRLIQERPGVGFVEGTNPLIYFLDDPLLRKPLPESGAVPSSYARVFTNSGIARIRRDAVSATVYGGSDWPLGVASGLASNPAFFSLRKGKAVLESVRMAGQFFSEGVFRGEGLIVVGGRYALHQRFDAPYYQPLPKNLRNPRGDYALTPARDVRFWSKLDFPHRQMSNVQVLDQKVTVTENQGSFELHFDITGHNRVPYTVELAFRPGGELSGSLQEFTTRDNAKAYLLRDGIGRYKVGDDVIEFGPGQAEHQQVSLSGPSYTAHGASLRTGGTCVYITGFTPFQKTITIKPV
jgi:hypothetical protein